MLGLAIGMFGAKFLVNEIQNRKEEKLAGNKLRREAKNKAQEVTDLLASQGIQSTGIVNKAVSDYTREESIYLKEQKKRRLQGNIADLASGILNFRLGTMKNNSIYG